MGEPVNGWKFDRATQQWVYCRFGRPTLRVALEVWDAYMDAMGWTS